MILPFQKLIEMTKGDTPSIFSDSEITEDQVQTASVDCSLGRKVFRMKATALPSSSEKIDDLIEKLKLYEFDIDPKGSSLEVGGCYIVKLNENLNLPKNFRAIFSPKSSIGRVDVFVRAIFDGCNQYDKTPYGYKGSIYLEIIPLSFGVKITKGLEMIQFRIRENESLLNNEELFSLDSENSLQYWNDGRVLEENDLDIADDSLFFHVDLDREVVGFEARSNSSSLINLAKIGSRNIEDFWLPIKRPKEGNLILEPNKFYLLASKERVRIPKDCCAEVLPYDVASGEFRSHYAGFFDNGFGGDKGTNAVLEVRVRDMPHRLVDGQRICRMVFERTSQVPSKLYGVDSGSNYIGCGPSVSKHFKDRESSWCE
ncbi:2'-deoxycytidine 5'-triphosphate deaminase [Patescibacteria group bacterium]